MPRFKEMPMPPSQTMLFGVSVEDALPKDSDVRVFGEMMDYIDYGCLVQGRSERGCPPYHPKVMAKVLTYAYSKGIRSSRRIEELLKIDVRFIWLSGGLKPDHNTIARFRKENWEAFEGLFKESVRLCGRAGLVLLNAVAVDGTKISAAASRRQVYNQAKVDRQLELVEKILREAEEVDRAEDEAYGEGTIGEIPDHLKDAKARKEYLEKIAKQLKEEGKKTIVVTDPGSRVMKVGMGLGPAYNVQAAVDSENQVVLAMKVVQEPDDHGELPDMVEEVISSIGASPDVSLADCGYVDEETLTWIAENKHDVLMPLQESGGARDRNDLFDSRCFTADDKEDALVCPAGRLLTYRGDCRCGSGTYRRYEARGCQGCSFYSQCVPTGKGSRRIRLSIVEEQRTKMGQRLRSEEGRALYDLRRETVEPVFGQKKSNQGFTRFVARGLNGAKAESALMFLAHNITKCATKAEHLVIISALQPILQAALIIGGWYKPARHTYKQFQAGF